MSTIRTLKKLAARYAFIEQTPQDVDENYSSVGPVVLGCLHVFFALFSLALGIGSICTHASGYYMGYGIWCGFVFLIVGIVTLVNACVKNSAMIVTSLVFNILGWCFAAVQFSLGIVAAANDGDDDERHSSSLLSSRYDFYYSKIYSYHCAGLSSRTSGWEHQWGAVDVLLILVGAFESFIAVICVVLCIRSICCGTVHTREKNPRDIRNGSGGGYTNGGYGMAPSVMYLE